MQRVTNCILEDKEKGQVLMLKKPRRGWYVAPGGKMESGEYVKQSASREFFEETGLTVNNPELRGVFTFVMKEGKDVVQEWMMFTFYADQYSGDLLEESPEGELEWVPFHEVLKKPMAEGDRKYFEHILKSDDQVYGTFMYTTDFQLIDVVLDPASPS
ncbi:8-oxo-dGTP diphosphatase [Pontibacillus sp. HMF3514]|uniref:8-oxo-dGTP diphosphatase n=1 Tax=Pontibacillus sp. HMF3514 TaxID=2692425 RepID=UPI00132020B3|nr:8-oxo-dGTP diphosphatase [Pontibacillus sp. HMF3514]QHE53535.1 NUDIX domain-containing protein [Pontibacillus sp. HMF3514]